MAEQRPESQSLDLVPVRIHALYPPVKIEAALYFPETTGMATRLYTTAAKPPSAADLQRIERLGINTLYMAPDDVNGLRGQLRELITSDAEMPSEVRLGVAREAAKADFAKAWKSDKTDDMMSQAVTFSELVVDVCSCENEMASVLESIASHDGDTFAHISNVCTYSVMLARGLGISDDNELMKIGQAALLHDLGKRRICADILKKPAALTKEEREVIAQHPGLGFEELCHRADLSRDQLLMVYEHHEKLDGTGYPVQLTGNEINWMAKLCAVVDVFDALTARRSYREPAKAEKALEILQRGNGSHFCPEMLACWADIIKNASAQNIPAVAACGKP